ncbi:TetR/AcrR family transcriptional regulator [Gordonia desulfuricans]|uniref:TetR/AcrR family transcriptional regulator n=2 Tax=Gordonia desulfuricans TaxID=89051 RepID=A0A7K3LKJ9_9ACTN|nr:TetR family transcriptional regulator [Gordonia desulfuricans]NDK88785.1 TetR/AcrR family transcriptional regulator [Gordonia desulfuricans]
MLAAASELATDHELARVQMQEVARRADVAIATLYRYFPSKTHLFVAVMLEEIRHIQEALERRPPDGVVGTDAIYAVLVRATRSLLRRPLLANAMIQSNASANSAVVPDTAKVEQEFWAILLTAAGVSEPTDDDSTAVRLLTQLWLGVLQSCLNDRITVPDAEADIRSACDLLLVRMSVHTTG